MAAEQEYQIRNKHMLVIAAVLGLLGVIIVLWHVHAIRQENAQDMVTVLCAERDLMPGDRLQDDSIDQIKLPQSMVPTDMLNDIARPNDRASLIGLEVTQEVARGKVLLWNYVRPPATKSGSIIEPKSGWRLVSIKVTRENCPATVEAGMLVDLMTNVTMPNGTPKTVPVMEMVRVKTVTGVGGSSRNIDSLIVEVPEGQEDYEKHASKLQAFMKMKGDLVIWTRNPQDKAKSPGKFTFDLTNVTAGGRGPN